MSTAPATLLVTSLKDIASVNMRDALLKREGWSLLNEHTHAHRNGAVWLHTLGDSSLLTDDIDVKFCEEHNLEGLTDVIYLSRHAAASGQPVRTCCFRCFPNESA
jgi:D-tyrosyl-tRNA(Tyr) deacylase